jgi:hypothetical protein
VTKVSHNFPEFVLILNNAIASEEGESDCDLPVDGVGLDEDVAIGAFVVSKGESSELYALVQPLSVYDMAFV